MIQKTVGFRVNVNNNKAKQKQTKKGNYFVNFSAQSLKSDALIASWNTHHCMKSVKNKIPVAGIYYWFIISPMACTCWGWLRNPRNTNRHKTIEGFLPTGTWSMSLSTGDWHMPLVAPTQLKATAVTPLKGKTETTWKELLPLYCSHTSTISDHSQIWEPLILFRNGLETYLTPLFLSLAPC